MSRGITSDLLCYFLGIVILTTSRLRGLVFVLQSRKWLSMYLLVYNLNSHSVDTAF
jgi:hypothetical protein